MLRGALGTMLLAVALSSSLGGRYVVVADDGAVDKLTGAEAQPTIVVATVAPTAVPTQAPLPTAVPTMPPPPTAVPTLAPPPTAVPVPTQAPPVSVPEPTATVPPAAPPVEEEVPGAPSGPTEQPIDGPGEKQPEAVEEPTIEPTVEPTATTEPTPTVEPTATPTPTPSPTPSPTPTPTPEPAIPFDPHMACVQPAGATPAVAGSPEWAYLDCAVTWQTKDMTEVLVQKPDAPVGWDIVLVNNRQSEDPAARLQNPSPFALKDSDTGDDGFLTTTFSIASRVGCEADASATVSLAFTATSGPM